MPGIDEDFQDLRSSHRFAEIRRRTDAFTDASPGARIVDSGVGDRARPPAQVVGPPGAGFGPTGEGHFRPTAFGTREQTDEAAARIRSRAS